MMAASHTAKWVSIIVLLAITGICGLRRQEPASQPGFPGARRKSWSRKGAWLFLESCRHD